MALHRHSNVRVAVRTRPTAAWDQDEIFFDEAGGRIQVHRAANFDAVSNKLEDWAFKFDNVLHNSTQDHVYGNLCERLVADACDGRTGCISALRYERRGARARKRCSTSFLPTTAAAPRPRTRTLACR